MKIAIIRLTPKQKSKIVKLIKDNCANYNNGNCILLDNHFGEEFECPQLLTYSLVCNYLKQTVVPSDPELSQSVLGNTTQKKCAVCGKCFASSSNRNKYCKDCADKIRKKRQREYMRKNRG